MRTKLSGQSFGGTFPIKNVMCTSTQDVRSTKKMHFCGFPGNEDSMSENIRDQTDKDTKQQNVYFASYSLFPIFVPNRLFITDK